MVISEMVANTNGIGFFVLQSQRFDRHPGMWSRILLLGILGYVFNLAFMISSDACWPGTAAPGRSSLG